MPTILTLKQHEIAVTIVNENNELCVEDMFDMFRTAFVGVSFTNEHFEQYVLEFAEQLKQSQLNALKSTIKAHGKKRH
jgi:hypothetical protein